MRLIISGDWHGNISHASAVLRSAMAEKIDRIVQVGDFGLWPEKGGKYYLDKLNENAEKRGVRVVWLDGNHEDHDQIDRMLTDGNAAKRRTSEGFWKFRENVLYSPRGNRWDWAGKTFMTVGGAVSIDKQFRTPGKSWWPQEELTDEQAMSAADSGKVDYLFTHDAPPHIPMRLWAVGKESAESAIHRDRMQRVGQGTRPELWFHGHYHKYLDYTFPYYDPFSRVIGLDMDGTVKSSVVLDTDNNSISPLWIS